MRERESYAMIIQRDKALRHFNTLGLQSHARAFATVSSDEDLLAALEWVRAQQMPVLPMGEGSNVVLSERIDALVLRQQTKGIDVLQTNKHKVTLRVAAGESWHGLVQWTLLQGLYGLQNLALIPGTVGAAPIQNIGAYGVELESALVRVHAMRIADTSRLILDKESCEFAYRDSIFKRELMDQVVITAVDLMLSLTPDIDIRYPALQRYFNEHSHLAPTPESVYEAVVNIRRERLPDPAIEPNAGSFFKNPVVQREQARILAELSPQLPQFPQPDDSVKLSAAWMIEHCGWKGYRRDEVGVHPHHALVLVNYGSNSAARLLSLAADIADSVYQTFGVQLEREPRLYGVVDG
jgi:UDP-N-acetylmuramate dehydrogenase